MSVDAAYMDSGVDTPFLQRKLGPLPYWSIGVAGIVIVGYVWYRSRSSSGSSDTSVGYAADATGNTPVTDYGQGFDYGYAAGFNATGDSDAAQDSSESGDTNSGNGTKPPLQHTRYCFRETDPSGVSRLVCSFGHWVKKGGEWKWEVGAPKGGRTDGTKTPPHHRNEGNRTQALGVIPAGQRVNYATV